MVLNKLQENNEEDGTGAEEHIESEPDCSLRPGWGPWEPCSVTCGEGYKVRYKKPFDEEKCDPELTRNQTRPCSFSPCPMPGK